MSYRKPPKGPDGTVYDQVRPRLAEIAKTGRMISTMTNTAVVIPSSPYSIPLSANMSSDPSLGDWNRRTRITHRTGPEQISTNFETVVDWVAVFVPLRSDASTSPVAFSTTDQEKYFNLFCAIEELSSLDEEDSHFIDGSAARAARHFLSLLCLYSVSAPQIFSHGGDAVVFKWSVADEITAYVTVGDGAVSFHRYRSGSPLSPPMSFTPMSEQELVTLMLQLGGKQWRAVSCCLG